MSVLFAKINIIFSFIRQNIPLISHFLNQKTSIRPISNHGNHKKNHGNHFFVLPAALSTT